MTKNDQPDSRGQAPDLQRHEVAVRELLEYARGLLIENTALRERERGWVSVEELRSAIDKARRLTASDPKNQWCRQATIILNAAFTGTDQGIPLPPAEKKG
jgi:hypothetical protein